MIADVEQTVRACTSCREVTPSHANQPLLENQKASKPFERIHIDLASAEGDNWLIAVDELSGYLAVRRLGQSTTSDKVVKALREVFEVMDTPRSLKPDGGSQLVSEEVRVFLKGRRIALEPSSPTLPKTNGKAEAAVKAAKKIIRGAKGDDEKIALGLNAFRNQCKEGEVPSPSELAYGRLRREPLPMSQSERCQRQREMESGMQRRENARREYTRRYNQRARSLKPFDVGERVVVQDRQKRWTLPGTISEGPTEDRDYLVAMDNGGVWRRNRELIRRLVEASKETPPPRTPAEEQEEQGEQSTEPRRSERLRLRRA